MGIGAGIFGTLAGLANTGEQFAGANQSIADKKSTSDAAAATAQQRQDAIDQRRAAAAAAQAARLAKKPLGTPFLNDKGQMVQRFYNPGTSELTVEPITGGDATPAPKPKAPVKDSPEKQKYDFLSGLFGPDKAKAMMDPAYGKKKSGGGGGPVDPNQVIQAANAIANNRDGTYTPTMLKGLNKPLAEAVNTYMLAHNLKPGAKETVTEKNSEDSVKQVNTLIPQILPKLQSHANDDFLDSLMDAAQMKSNFMLYRHGVYTGPDQDLMQMIAAASLLGAQPWLKTGRNRQVFEAIQSHLPQPTDSRKSMYQKLLGLQTILKSVQTPTGAPDVDYSAGETLTLTQ